MATTPRVFTTGRIYHVFNRGVEKRRVVQDVADAERFLKALAYYQQHDRSSRLSMSDFEPADRVEPLRFSILSYCLMPNHFHIVVRQLSDDGISQGIADLCNSYTRYFNTRHERVGPLFQGTFKAVSVDTDEQLLHVVRYVLLNPVAASILDDPGEYRWSSYLESLDGASQGLSDPNEFRQYFQTVDAWRSFIHDHIGYARSLETAKHLLFAN